MTPASAVYVYNNVEFSPRDFENLSRIGQASKMEKLTTTGRFGLGFNSVYHFTGTGAHWWCTVCLFTALVCGRCPSRVRSPAADAATLHLGCRRARAFT